MSPNETPETTPQQDSQGQALPFTPRENEQELYLEHLMNMMVNVLDRGFQKG